MFKADIAAATVLISMGAVLGRTSYMQLLVMGVLEIAVFAGNAVLGDRVFQVRTAPGPALFYCSTCRLPIYSARKAQNKVTLKPSTNTKLITRNHYCLNPPT